MQFLRFLASIRTPWLDRFFLAVTNCGGELAFMLIAITVFWCISKRSGYYILSVGFAGILLNQVMKLAFRIPRPWVLDPDFQVVAGARPGATGYSFPSGHTQNCVGLMACIALETKKTWIRALAIALMLLVPFSRMYLGCHTLLDVSVAFVLALLLAFALRPVVARGMERPKTMGRLLLAFILLSLLAFCYLRFYPFPASIDAENLQEGRKAGAMMVGGVLALALSGYLDRRYVHFSVQAVWWAQILKVVLGFALLMLIRLGLKAPLAALLAQDVASGVRYFVMVLFAGAIWPATFPLFAALGKNRQNHI